MKNNMYEREYKREYTNTQKLPKDSDRMTEENTETGLPILSRRRNR
jgi:hypothetical protein